MLGYMLWHCFPLLDPLHLLNKCLVLHLVTQDLVHLLGCMLWNCLPIWDPLHFLEQWHVLHPKTQNLSICLAACYENFSHFGIRYIIWSTDISLNPHIYPKYCSYASSLPWNCFPLLDPLHFLKHWLVPRPQIQNVVYVLRRNYAIVSLSWIHCPGECIVKVL